jgi:hypothetical protein
MASQPPQPATVRRRLAATARGLALPAVTAGAAAAGAAPAAGAPRRVKVVVADGFFAVQPGSIGAARGKVIKCRSPLNVLKDTSDHSCY